MKGIAVVIGINIIALFGIFFFFKRRIDKSLRTEEVVTTIREEIEQMIVELNQTTNRNVDIIEERINQLKQVIASADKQIKVLNKEIRSKAQESETYLNLKPSPAAAQKRREETEKRDMTGDKKDSTKDRVLLLYNRGESAEYISKELGITVAEAELIITLSSRKG